MPEEPIFIIHQKADQDLELIFDYSKDRFGFERAVRYIRDIETEFKALALNPKRGKSFDPLNPHYLCKRVESHFIYYTECRKGIEVLRILHERMLPNKHLVE